MGVSLGTLDLVRVDGPGGHAFSGVVTQPFKFPFCDCQTDRSNFQHRLGPARYERQCVDGSRGSFQGHKQGSAILEAPLEALSRTNHGHDPPYCHREIAWGRASPACSRRARRRTAPWLELDLGP